MWGDIMSCLDELRPGKREHAFYEKTGVLCSGNYIEERANLPKKVYVYEWDEKSQKHIGHLVDTEQYCSRKAL